MMDQGNQIVVGGNQKGEKILFDAGMANRHGLITGATGTGKTVTLQVLAESFSRLGVPVFTADIKGDLSGIGTGGSENKHITSRLEKIGISDFSFGGCPVLFWDVLGDSGHPVRTTVSEMGPVLLTGLLDLNEVQSSLLHIAFIIADNQGLLLLDLKDLQSMLAWMSENRKELSQEYGNIATQSIGAIQRRLLVLRESGGGDYFNEPSFRIDDLLHRDFSGRGVVSLLDGTKLTQNPAVYASFLLWLLSELMEDLPEQGDAPLPKLVFFFDEAHLLFDNIPKALLDRVIQVVRLIRSKGVGIFFCSQYPNDIPEEILGQLGARFQHGLRAFTPNDRKALRAAANTFRENPELDTEKMISELGIGEILVSTLDEKGRPEIVQWCLVAPPASKIGPMDTAEKQSILSSSPVRGRYDDMVDRESAFEMLTEREAELNERRQQAEEAAQLEKEKAIELKKKSKGRGRTRQSAGEAFFKSMVRTIGTQVGRAIIRGILGSITGKR